MPKIKIRDEREGESEIISPLITLAFEKDLISDKREAEIVELMREDSALALSLVAELEGQVVGHIAYSKVTINNEFNDWYGLAPVSVLPECQLTGVGSRLILAGLERLKAIKAKGCVLLGSPKYYHRFGFEHFPQLILEGVPPQYFQALSFDGEVPAGIVKYHSAFG